MKRGVLFAGGGTLGPVTPLLAVARALRDQDSELPLYWAGTDSGPERDLIESHDIPFYSIPVAKLPRYMSADLLSLPYNFVRARHLSREILKHVFPRAIVSAGGFTAVPLVQEAVKVGIPCLSHQLDFTPGLSNRMIARLSRYVTTSFAYARSPFHVDVTMYQVPTPVRFDISDLPSREAACRYFGFEPDRPVVFVFGGGTGAAQLNIAMTQLYESLTPEIQIIHLTGKGKQPDIIPDHPGYVMKEFLSDDMLTAYAAADLVIARAGVGTIAELAATKKASILIPLPNSPQIANVRALKDAVIQLDSTKGEWVETLHQSITELLNDRVERERLGASLHGAFPTDKGDALAGLVQSIMV